MKNTIFFVLLIAMLFMPITINAATLTKRINIPISGIGDLDLSRNVHDITIVSKSNSVNIIVETNEEGVSIEGAGVTTLQEGTNTIAIKVSNDSVTEEFTLNINYSKSAGGAATTGGGKTNPETGATVSLITLSSLSILGIAFIKHSKKNKKLSY